MKSILLGVALTLVFASTSFAQSFDPDLGTGNLVFVEPPFIPALHGTDAMAAQPRGFHRSMRPRSAPAVDRWTID